MRKYITPELNSVKISDRDILESSGDTIIGIGGLYPSAQLAGEVDEYTCEFYEG